MANTIQDGVAVSAGGSSTITVQEARLILSGAAVHVEIDGFNPVQLDRAIRAAGHHFCRETQAIRSQKSVSITSGTRQYDLNAAIATGFMSDQIIGMPWIAATDWRPLQIVDFEVIRREYDVSGVTGRPQMAAFVGSTMTVFPTPDANYTLNLNAWDTLDLTNWTLGGVDSTTNAVTLNIPDRWCHDVIRFGGKWYLLNGAPGHPDAQAAWVDFHNLIHNAKGRGTRHGRFRASWKSTIEQGYGPRLRP